MAWAAWPRISLHRLIRSADGADNIGTALLLELPDQAAAEAFWNEEPFAANGGYQRDSRIVRWVFGDLADARRQERSGMFVRCYATFGSTEPCYWTQVDAVRER